MLIQRSPSLVLKLWKTKWGAASLTLPMSGMSCLIKEVQHTTVQFVLPIILPHNDIRHGEVGSGPVGKVADNQAVRHTAVFVNHKEVRHRICSKKHMKCTLIDIQLLILNTCKLPSAV